MTGKVYFIECQGYVKIGFTGDANIRLTQLDCGNPFPLTLIGSIECLPEAEGALHRKFAHLRHKKEWFWLSADLQAFIARGSLEGVDLRNPREAATPSVTRPVICRRKPRKPAKRRRKQDRRGRPRKNGRPSKAAARMRRRRKFLKNK